MSESQAPTLEQLKETLNNLAFIHQKMTTTQFYPEEFKQADTSLRMVIEMAERLAKDIEAKEPVKESKTEEASNEQA